MKSPSQRRQTRSPKLADANQLELTLTTKKKPTARQLDLIWETIAKHLGPVLAAGNNEPFAKFFKENYNRALYGRLRGPDEKRRAFEFLRRWRGSIIGRNESGKIMTHAEQIALLAPLIDALRELDAQFFKALAEA